MAPAGAAPTTTVVLWSPGGNPLGADAPPGITLRLAEGPHDLAGAAVVAVIESGCAVLPTGLGQAVSTLLDDDLDAVLTATRDPHGHVHQPLPWSPIQSRHWVSTGGLVVVGARALDAAGGLDASLGDEAVHDALLRMGAAARIGRSPVAAAASSSPPPSPDRPRRHAATVASRAGARARGSGAVDGIVGLAGAYRRRIDVSTTRPLVTLVVPTRDHPELLQMADRTIRMAGGSRVEAIFVDNGTTDPAAKDLLGRTPHRVLSAPIPFNFARLVNRGVAAARGDVVVLLNNDVEALDAGWVDPLLEELEDDDTGVAGTLLLYPSGAIQHCGIVVHHGVPRHPLVGVAPADAPAWAVSVPGDRTAVTGACLAMRTRDWHRLGGMSVPLATNYNDVDLCLRVAAEGRRVAFTPFAPLTHHESESRGRLSTPEVAADWLLFRSRWEQVLAQPDSWWPADVQPSDGRARMVPQVA